jgi:hypothetical protein
LVVGMLLAGCAESTLKPDAGEPAPPRVKERFVTIGIARFMTREITEGPDGKPAYGEIEPLDGADVCIVERRDAVATDGAHGRRRPSCTDCNRSVLPPPAREGRRVRSLARAGARAPS